MKRLLAVIKKEYKEFIRDRGLVLAIIIAPVVMMFVFGNTFSGNIRDLKTIVIDEDNSEYSQKIVTAIKESTYFKVVPFSGTLEEATKILKSSKVRVIFNIPAGFRARMKNARKGELRMYIDSSDYNIYNIVNGASGLVLKDSFKDIIQLVVSNLEEETDNQRN